MRSKLRLLLLSSGSLAAQNVIDALGERRERCLLIGVNSLEKSAGNFRCDVVFRVPPASSGAAYIDSIADIVRAERPDLVIPSRDDDVLALALLRERHTCIQSVLLTGTPATARMWEDKVETARFAARHGLPFAPTAENARDALALTAKHPLPLIGKPRAGNGSRGVVLLRSQAEIERAFEARPDLIAQPFLDPPANMQALIAPPEAGLPLFFSFPAAYQYIATVIVGPDGAVSEPITWLCTLVGGQSMEGTRCDDPQLLELGRAYGHAAAAEGWRGPLNIQLKRPAHGSYVAFEVNGRFSGGTAARTVLGFDEVGLAIKAFLPAVDFPLRTDPACDAIQKYVQSYPIPREGVEALRRSDRWVRADARSSDERV